MNRSLLTAMGISLIAIQAGASGLPKTSMQAIIKSLQDSSAEVRTAAAKALAQVPDESAERPLETALMASSNSDEQQAEVAALQAIGDREGAKRLMDALNNSQFTWGNGAKAKAIEVIGKNPDKKTIKWLTDLVNSDQEPSVRTAALNALGVAGAPPKKEKEK